MVTNQIGKVLKSYAVEELIGTGGFGAVYRARQSIVEREVAIKIIWPAFANHPNFIRRFEAEAQLVAGLEHPYIVPLYDYWRDPEGAYIVMRWIRGGPLRTRLSEDPYSLHDANRFLTQVGAALSLAHRYGVVHRDIKPENILLDEDGNAYLADFGIAQILSTSQQDEEMMGLGSPAYAAPEQVTGGFVSAQSDIYSLGIILFEMLTGQHPFPHLAEMSMTEMNEFRNNAVLPSAHELRSDLPKSIDNILQKATALDINERYHDAVSLAQAFQKAVTQGRQIIFDTPLSQVRQVIPNPYKGLRSFQETDANNFFGREALVHRLVGRMREAGQFSRFLSIVGPSGSGKSSLVKAGLIPALRQGAVSHSEQWFYDEFAPGNNPFDELVNSLMSIATDATEDELAQMLHASNLGLYEALNVVLPNDDTELFLFIDQFEEIFTLVDDEHTTLEFLELLYTAVTRPDTRLRLVITIRADFYDRPLLQPFLSDLVRERTEVVVPLSSIELERVIVEPARRVGVTIDGGLVTAIITEVKQQSGALPLLQYALSELFEHRDGSFISSKAYREIGGVRGALARRADELYQSLLPEEKRTTRQLFLRLITLGEGTEDTRRRALLSEITSLSSHDTIHQTSDTVIRDVVEQLGSARLVTFDRDPITRSPTIEVTHEAIIREWSLLRSWLDESRQDVRMQRALSSLASEWADNAQDASFVLRGARLEQFERWVEQTNLILTQQEADYLRTGIKRREQEFSDERERQEREAQLERRSVQRLRLLVVLFAIATIGAVLLSGFAFNESNRAETALATSDANASISRSLALEASARRALSEGNGDLALVLALAANEGIAEPPIQSRSTLSEVAFSEGSRIILQGHSAFVQSVDIQSDLRMIVSGSTDGSVKVWDLDTGEIIHNLEGHNGDVTSVTFSPDGRYIASGAYDFMALLWDVQTGELVRGFEGHTLPVQDIAFSSDGTRLVTASSDSSLIVWDIVTGEILQRYEGHRASVLTVTFSPDDSQILSGARDGSLYVWDVASAIRILELKGNTTGVNDVLFTPDGMQAVSAAGDGSIYIWSLETGEIISRFVGNNAEVREVAFSPDAKRLYSVGVEGQVIIWDVASGLEIGYLNGHTDDVLGIAISDDGLLTVTGSKDQSVRVWNTGAPAMEMMLAGHTERVTGVEYIRETATIVSASADGTLRLWSAETGEQQAIYTWDTPLLSLDVSPEKQTALIGSRNGVLRLVSLQDGNVIYELEGHTGTVLSTFFYQQGAQAITTGQNGEIIRWDLQQGTILQTYEGVEVAIYGVTLTDDNRLVTADRDGMTHVWDFETGEILAEYADHESSVYAVDSATNPYLGNMIATGSRDQSVILRDAQSGDQIARLLDETDTIWTIDFSQTGDRLVAGAADGNIVVWDIASDNKLQEFTRADVAVFTLKFMEDDNLLIAGYEDGQIILWRSYETNEIIAWTQANRFIRDLTCLERTQYRVEPFCDA
jgi:WD40 repeat protein/serine/threonine protein kinase